jgi:sugar phosphate isomerase/epimerase
VIDGSWGLQLWSVQRDLERDPRATLRRVRGLGVREVETAGLAGFSPAEFRAALSDADLVCRSMHVDFERLRDAPAEVAREATALGATYAVCPWIPHDERAGLTRDEARHACAVFNAAGRVAAADGIRVGYHCHGYEFVPSPGGTLFDAIVVDADPALVSFEIDVFWARAGGADPAVLVASLAGRVPLLHVKDMKKGLALSPGSSSAPADADVVVGTGQLDIPAIVRAARRAGAEIFYLEDESGEPWQRLPESLRFVAGEWGSDAA